MCETIPLGTRAMFDQGEELFNTAVRLIHYDCKQKLYRICLSEGVYLDVPPSSIKLLPSTRCMLINRKNHNVAGVVHSDLEGNKYKVFLVGSYKLTDVPFSEVVSLE